MGPKFSESLTSAIPIKAVLSSLPLTGSESLSHDLACEPGVSKTEVQGNVCKVLWDLVIWFENVSQ